MKRRRILYSLLCGLLCAALALRLWPLSGAKTALVLSPVRRHIVIDAGHGGFDGGAVGSLGTLEKDLNLQIARKCELLLVLLGVDAAMTRREDTALDAGMDGTIAQRKAHDIRSRVSIANAGADALVSIHMNSFPDPKYSGTQVFFSKNHAGSAALAAQLQTAARTLLSPENRRESKAADSGIYLLKHVVIPAVIVECGFLSNPDEEQKLRDDAYQNAVASAICAGVVRYLYETA